MTTQKSSDERTVSSRTPPACDRCEERATVEVICTPIERSPGPPFEASATTTGLCRDCLNQFRADPDLSFGTLFERSSIQRCITVNRL
ncbi:hypothetical protein [Haladaptatus sp. NG-WS-4]